MKLINQSTRITTEKASKILAWVASKVGVEVKTELVLDDWHPGARHKKMPWWPQFLGEVEYGGGVTISIPGIDHIYMTGGPDHYGHIMPTVGNIEEYVVSVGAHELQHLKDLGQEVKGDKIVAGTPRVYKPSSRNIKDYFYAFEENTIYGARETLNRWLEYRACETASNIVRQYNEEKAAGLSFDTEQELPAKT